MRSETIVKNVVKNMLRPAYFPVMISKALLRIFDRNSESGRRAARNWCESMAEDCGQFARALDPELWLESQKFAEGLKYKAADRLSGLPVDLGGGGNYPLLYFLTRVRQPAVVLETGVAAGFSSQAILAAIKQNGRGRLYSSDFPYFRLDAPERYVGYVVEEDLKSNWELFLRGDRQNLDEILRKVNRVDIFHYDSDKTHSGRVFAMRRVQPYLASDAIIIMDDIQDNVFFRGFVEDAQMPYRVFGFEGKFLGMTGI